MYLIVIWIKFIYIFYVCVWKNKDVYKYIFISTFLLLVVFL